MKYVADTVVIIVAKIDVGCDLILIGSCLGILNTVISNSRLGVAKRVQTKVYTGRKLDVLKTYSPPYIPPPVSPFWVDDQVI